MSNDNDPKVDLNMIVGPWLEERGCYKQTGNHFLDGYSWVAESGVTISVGRYMSDFTLSRHVMVNHDGEEYLLDSASPTFFEDLQKWINQ